MNKTYTGMAGYTMQGNCFDMLLLQNPHDKEANLSTESSVKRLKKRAVLTSISKPETNPPVSQNEGSPEITKENNMELEQAKQLDDTREGFYVDCPRCDGEGGKRYLCDCLGAGCWKCKGEGIIKETCKLCDGHKEIFVTVDTGLDVFEEVAYAEAFKTVSNQIIGGKYGSINNV